jgi:hypothetical protein
MPGAHPSRLKRQGREDNHSPPSSGEVKNVGAIPPQPHMSSPTLIRSPNSRSQPKHHTTTKQWTCFWLRRQVQAPSWINECVKKYFWLFIYKMYLSMFPINILPKNCNYLFEIQQSERFGSVNTTTICITEAGFCFAAGARQHMQTCLVLSCDCNWVDKL